MTKGAIRARIRRDNERKEKERKEKEGSVGSEVESGSQKIVDGTLGSSVTSQGLSSEVREMECSVAYEVESASQKKV